MIRHFPDFSSGYTVKPIIDAAFDSFADDLFRVMWYGHRICEVALPRARNYSHEIEPSVVDDVSYCVWVRRMFFEKTLNSVCRRFFKKKSSSAIDFYTFFENNVASIMPAPDMCVYDRLFMACVFILEMGLCCATNSNNTHIYAAPLSLSMYFDTHLRKDFYSEGGWIRLMNYAAKHKACRLFSAHNLTSICNNHNDVSNALASIQNVEVDCDLSAVLEVFIETCQEFDEQETLTCRRCLPLFLALKNRAVPYAEYDRVLLTEGYLQFAMRTPSDIEIKEYLTTIRDRFEKIREGTAFDPDLDPSQIPPEGSQEFLNLLFKVVRQTATDSLIRNLFPDDLNTTLDSDASIETIERCIFCTQDINWPELLPRQFALVKSLECIKATIESNIDYVPELYLEHDKFSKTKVADVCFGAYEEKLDNFRAAQLDAIHLFQSLGYDPQKTDQVQDKINLTWFFVPDFARKFLDHDKQTNETPKSKKKSRKESKKKETEAEAEIQ